MDRWMHAFSQCALLLGMLVGSLLKADVIFQDGFETGELGSAWTVSGVDTGRVRVTSDFSPYAGSKHLVLDDSVDDAAYGVAEATLSVDLTNWKNVYISVRAKSLGNVTQGPPDTNFTAVRNFDGATVSIDGGTTWHRVALIGNAPTYWQGFRLQMDAIQSLLGSSYSANTLIRFSFYGKGSAPNDGIALDSVSLEGVYDPKVSLDLPYTVGEGSGPHTGTVRLPSVPGSDVVVALTSAIPGLSLPESVTIPAGQQSANFLFTAPNDDAVNPNRRVLVTATTSTFGTGSFIVAIQDNETPPTATLTLPAQVVEGGSVSANNAKVSLSAPSTVPIVFDLFGIPVGELTMPYVVTIPAGQTEATFTIRAYNDILADGPQVVTVTAAAVGLAPAQAQITAVDNEVQKLELTLPASLVEGASGTATVTIPIVRTTDQQITLYSAVSSSVKVPASVTIPAGQLSTTFSVTSVDDGLINLTRTVTIGAAATGYTSATGYQKILDNEAPPVLSLSVPAQIQEDSYQWTSNSTVSLNTAAAMDITVSLTLEPSGEGYVDYSVTIPAGQTYAAFTIFPADDDKIDGDVTVVVSATSPGLEKVFAQTVIVDDEKREIHFSAEGVLHEGNSLTGIISIPGTLPSDLVINVAHTATGSVTIPSTVTIPAGSTYVEIPVAVADNAEKDGARNYTVTLSAASFPSSSYPLVVKDDDPASYQFSNFTDIMRIDGPVTVTVQALDVEGGVISGFLGEVNLNVAAQGNVTLPVTPAKILITPGSGWTGQIVLPANTPGGSWLRAVDADGTTGESTEFDTMRILSQQTADLIWDKARGKVYASVPQSSTSVHANKVIAIDTATLQITGSVLVGQDPKHLALTDGGEYLYVALDANGTIAKINPTTFTVVSTFAVGTSSSYGTLYASDISTVAGSPNTLVVSQYRKSVSPGHNGVAVYDNGVMRSVKTQDHTGSNVIEPSADPSIFFGYNTESSEYGFRRLQVTSSGITELQVNRSLLEGYSQNIRSAGNLVYSDTGVAIDGSQMRRMGQFPVNGLACPDAASSRVFYAGSSESYYYWSRDFNFIGAYDPGNFSTIRKLTMPLIREGKRFIRAGSGFALSTADEVSFISTGKLVPSQPTADLAVTVEPVSSSASVGGVVTYQISLTNRGPNPAREVVLSTELTNGLAVNTAVSNLGPATITGSKARLLVNELALGGSVSLSITAKPTTSGSLICDARADSSSLDTDFSNNRSFGQVSVGYQPNVDVFNTLGVPANNLLNDKTRGTLWASISSANTGPLSGHVVSIDPRTGIISSRIPLRADAMPGAFALSENGRYLYVGLKDAPEVARIDLAATPPSVTRIPLGLSQWGYANYALDIEVLAGDGLSFIIAGSSDSAAAIFDGSQMRPTRTGIYSVTTLEKTSVPNTFVGYNSSTSGYETTKLVSTSTGVTVAQSVGSLLSGYYGKVRGEGGLLLSDAGKLINSDSLTLKFTLNARGIPCVDAAYQRAYLVTDAALLSFNVTTGNPAGSVNLPSTSKTNWVADCVRWGRDGFAILGNEGNIYITRWSEAIPAERDENADGISDRWASTHFNTLGINPAADSDGDGIADGMEYFFGSHPKAGSRNPLAVATAEDPVNSVIHLKFPRRKGIARSSYDYETSPSIGTWGAPAGVTETVMSTQTVDGVEIENVDATIRTEKASRGFVRMKWK